MWADQRARCWGGGQCRTDEGSEHKRTHLRAWQRLQYACQGWNVQLRGPMPLSLLHATVEDCKASIEHARRRKPAFSANPNVTSILQDLL